jgi:hypothetical protein
MATQVTRKRAAILFADLSAFIAREIPGFEIRYKNESFVQKLIAVVVWIFNRHYMKKYVSTIYPIVWFPSREFVAENPWKATKILAHEYVHLLDAKGEQRWWKFCYLLPQSLTFPLALTGAIVCAVVGAPWWTFPLLGLVSTAPWPAAFRRDAELRGYAMNMVVNVWRYGSIRRSTIEWIVNEFTGPPYYFMWPFRKNMTERVVEVEGEITFGRIYHSEAGGKPYAEVIRIFEGNG